MTPVPHGGPNPAALPEGVTAQGLHRLRGARVAIYNDGYVFDGRGWRNSLGQATYDDGVVVTKAPVDIYPPNNAAARRETTVGMDPAGRPDHRGAVDPDGPLLLLRPMALTL